MLSNTNSLGISYLLGSDGHYDNSYGKIVNVTNNECWDGTRIINVPLTGGINSRTTTVLDSNGAPQLIPATQVIGNQNVYVPSLNTNLEYGYVAQMNPPLTNALSFGPAQKLDTLVGNGSPWSQITANSINDYGVIVGSANYTPTNAGPLVQHGVILWPLPKYFLDQALTQTLDDWPATGSLLRSPKHILAQGDNIYIRVQGPPGLGNSAVTVIVTSDSDTTGISVPLAEISPGIYSDQSPALPLQLSTATGTVNTGTTPSAYTIKVIDKEVLKFNFNLNGIKFTGSDVMVLRGKFASCGINVFYSASGGDQSPVRTQAIGNAKFFSAGDGAYDDNVVSEGNPMATFIQNAGDGSDGQAVWLHISSHGGPAGDLSDNDRTINRVYEGLTFTQGAGTSNAFTWTHNVTPIFGGAIIAPGNIDTSAHWNKDLEWVVLASCDQLNVDGGGFAAWQPILTGSPRSVHGILGAYNELSGDLQDQINDFWNRMQNSSSPEYIIDAYGTAMEDANSTSQPYAMLLDQANIDDKLKTITQDSNAGSKFLFLNVDTIIEGRVGSSLDSPVYGVIDNGNGLVRTVWPSVTGVNVSEQKRLSTPLPFTRIKHLAFARKTSESSNGKQDFLGKRFTETLNYQTSLSKQQAVDLARNYLSQQFSEFSSRLKLKEVSERESGLLSANGKAFPSTNGYLVQFSVLSEGLPVWGNFVNVSIQGDQIEAVHFLCNQDGEPNTQNAVQPLDGPSSLITALPDIKNALGIKSQYEVFKAELFYVNRSTAQGLAPNLASDFIPAWHLVVNKSYGGPNSTRDLHEVWIDAVTGKLLGHKRY